MLTCDNPITVGKRSAKMKKKPKIFFILSPVK
jgi:hypothetical protein